MYDVLDPCDTVPDEWWQRATSGYDVEHLRAPIMAAAGRGDRESLAVLRDELALAQRSPGWPYEEPSTPEAILAALDRPALPPPWEGSDEGLADRIHGAWLGRCAGCCTGKPVEGLARAEVAAYLAATGGPPLTGYLPLLDTLPAGVASLHESAPWAARGRFDMTPRDDDQDWTILGLHVLETYGPRPSTEDIAREWLDRVPFTQTYTAERAAYRNLVRGLRPPDTATIDNPYREWIGALIRADAWAYTHPGDPTGAVGLALTDARLSHVDNGIYGEMWASALVSSAFTTADARQALQVARTWIPPRCRLGAALDRVLALYDTDASWETATDELQAEFGNYPWIHTVNNAAAIAAGLLWGAGEFARTVELTVRAGADTDSTCASVGSVFGALHGVAALPASWVDPLRGHVRSAVRDFDRIAIAELAARTTRLALAFRKPG